jgi:hypothetical protein
MNVFKLESDFENFFSFMIEGGELYSKMPNYSQKFKARPRIHEWVVPNAQFYQSDNYSREGVHIPDITMWPPGNIILNGNARKVLSPILEGFGEFLEVKCEGVSYYIFNVLKVIPDDYIDPEKTKENIVSGIFTGLESLGFKDFDPKEFPVFKTPADKLANTYCSDVFHSFVLNAKLNGIFFNGNLC